MSLKDRLLKVGAEDVQTISLEESHFFTNDDFTQTTIPIFNLALSGKFDGGLTNGITSIAAPSKHFKTLFALLMVSAYLRKHPDAICVFFDNEFGSTPSYFASYGIDLNRVIHVPFKNIHQLRSDCYKKLQEVKHGEKVIFFVDSLGNAASIKEIDNADKEKDTADMTRAKDIKSFFRIVTPEVRMLEIPMVVVNHTYETQEMFSKTVQSGGTGATYNPNTVIFITKAQIKDDKTKEIVGYKFSLVIDKSRYIKEKSKLPIDVSYDEGINLYSGLYDLAMDLDFLKKETPKAHTCSRLLFDEKTGELYTEERKWKRAETDCIEFWRPMLKENKPFIDAVTQKFCLGTSDINASKLTEEANLLLG